MQTVSNKKEDQGSQPPEHIAIIMDGNGRWAKAQGLPRTIGHQRGAESVRETVKASIALGVKYLTLFGFSSENWKRPVQEVNELMSLLRHYLINDIDELIKNGVRLRVIGQRLDLSSDIVIGRAFKPLPVVLELMNKNFVNYKNLILFMGKNGKQTLKDAFKDWKFEYKEKMSLTSDDSFLIKIKNIKKKN